MDTKPRFLRTCAISNIREALAILKVDAMSLRVTKDDRFGVKGGPSARRAHPTLMGEEPTNASIARSAAAPTSSGSSPTATPSSASSEPSWPNSTTNGSSNAATLASSSSHSAEPPSSARRRRQGGHPDHRRRDQRLTPRRGITLAHHSRRLDAGLPTRAQVCRWRRLRKSCFMAARRTRRAASDSGCGSFTRIGTSLSFFVGFACHALVIAGPASRRAAATNASKASATVELALMVSNPS